MISPQQKKDMEDSNTKPDSMNYRHDFTELILILILISKKHLLQDNNKTNDMTEEEEEQEIYYEFMTGSNIGNKYKESQLLDIDTNFDFHKQWRLSFLQIFYL